MDTALVLDFVRETCLITLRVSAPVLLVSFFVGLTVSLFQALTQIQEATISFIPKLIAILCAFFLSFHYMLAQLTQFTLIIFDKIKAP